MTKGFPVSQQAWMTWREEHEVFWREEHGWLSLVSLDWLTADPQQLEHFPGAWSTDDHLVSALFTAEDAVTRDGQPVVGLVHLQLEPDESDRSLEDSLGRVAEVASRYGKIGIRVRDPQSPVRIGYAGSDTFDFDADWLVHGEWHPYGEPRQIHVLSAQEGQRVGQTAWGEAVLPRLAHDRPVVITGDSLDDLHLIFTDDSNGELTEAWRHAPVLVDQGGTLTIDFNRSSNFPAHFTGYGTCPMAPVQNHFAERITAGEKKIASSIR